jgi:hypothetical protein
VAGSRKPLGAAAGLVANFLVLGLLVYLLWLEGRDPDAYRAAVQEDEYLEWATFWAFLLGAGVAGWAAFARRRGGERPWPWFLAGIALFCFLVAGEEVSWGRRIFGYRPSEYFLEHNFQQEPNLHNVLPTDLRKLGLKAILAGYGVLLPLASLVPAVRRRFAGWGVVPPPWMLAPIFAGAFLTYQIYPVDYAGEIVELLLGMGLLVAALTALPAVLPHREQVVRVAAAWALAMGLGFFTAGAVRNQHDLWPARIELARTEVDALRADLLSLADPEDELFPTRCGLHKRVYTFVREYEVPELGRGTFGRLQHLPPERAEFFIDPWNAPYRIRDRCHSTSGRRAIFIYSFGPNRRRDSGPWELHGDAVGAYVLVPEND